MKVQIKELASKTKNKKEEQMKEQLQKIQLNSKTKNQKENKMKATRNFTLAMMTAILSFTLSSCSENPVNSLSQDEQLQGTNMVSSAKPKLSPLSSGNQVSETVDSKAKEFRSSFKIEPGETIGLNNQTLPMGSFSGIKIRNMTMHAADVCDRISYFLLEIPGRPPSGSYEACLYYNEEVKESGENFHALEITNLSDYVLLLELHIYQ